MKYKISTLFSIFLYVNLFFVSQSFAQQKSCTKTNPRVCVGDSVVVYGKDGYQVTGIASDQINVTTSYNSDIIGPSSLGVKKGICLRPNPSLPKICPGDKIVVYGKTGYKVTGILPSGVGFYSNYNTDTLAPHSIGVSAGCGQTIPKYCFGDTVTVYGKSGYSITGINPINKSYYTNYNNDEVSVYSLALNSRANRTGIDALNVDLTTDHIDVVEAYSQYSKVVTRERAGFAKSLGQSVSSTKSGDVDLFAGFLLSKLVRLSTAQVIKDNFEPSVAKYLESLKKQNWNSVMQIAGNDQTISFAIQVIAAGVRIRNTQAGVSPENRIRLETLAAAAAKKGMVAKAIAVREFLLANMVLIEDLVADPRHGAIGSIVADAAQWLNKQFEE